MGVAAVSATLNVGGIADAKIQAKLADRDRPYIVPYLTPQENFGIEELDKEDDPYRSEEHQGCEDFRNQCAIARD